MCRKQLLYAQLVFYIQSQLYADNYLLQILTYFHVYITISHLFYLLTYVCIKGN